MRPKEDSKAPMAHAGDIASPWYNKPYLLALLGAVLLYICFFPLNWGWLGWVAIIPFLHLTQLATARPRSIYLASWLGGLAFAIGALQWVRLASFPMYATW